MDKNGDINRAGAGQTLIAEVNSFLETGPPNVVLGASCAVGNSPATWENVKLVADAAHAHYRT